MFYAMIFIRNEWGNDNIRALRAHGYKTIEAAKKAIENKKAKGYVKKINVSRPVWSNVL
jgi:hypothetical protein